MNNPISNNGGCHSRLDHILDSINNKQRLPRSKSQLHVVRSWERCIKDYKLNPDDQAENVILGQSELEERCSDNWSFLSIAQFEIENLYEQVAGSGSAIMVVDKGGYVLKYLGDREFSEVTQANGLRAGANWSEAVQGTNAMGTCLAEREPLLIHHTDHFFARNTSLTCTAAPIFDAQGELLGVLDVSSSSNLAQQHTAVLVNMSAQMIENRVFLDSFRNFYIIRFHSRPEFINTLGEGIVAFDPQGNVVALNRCARQQFGLQSVIDNRRRSVRELFEATEHEMLVFAERQSMYPSEIRCAQNGRRFYALGKPPATLNQARIFSFNRSDKSNNNKQKASEAALIDRLELGDDYTRECIERAKKVVNASNLPIIISGETGTGKGLLAKALHGYSDRASKPYISINCAAIPETLLESELFGYSGGTFTGANRSGNIGKVRAADGGTLFLDEIGDMPLHLQTALLQVLEDREVIPLGSSTPIPIDIRLISATHQDLQTLVEEREFRDDLLYRLQGLTIRLPALRERNDFAALALKFLNDGASEEMTFSEEALNIIQNYSWPGNIRQLRNIIHSTRIFARSSVIHGSELPDEILTGDGRGGVNQAMQANPVNEKEEIIQSLSPLEVAESKAIANALKQYSWSVTKVAKNLNLSRTTLYRKMKKYRIKSMR